MEAPSNFAVRTVPAGRGIEWIKDAWALFKKKPGGWIGTVLLVWFGIGVISMIPVLGMLITAFSGPLLAIGFTRIAFVLDTEGKFSMKEIFYGLAEKPGEIVIFTFLNFFLFIAAFLIAFLPLSGKFIPLFSELFALFSSSHPETQIEHLKDYLPTVFLFFGIFFVVICLTSMATIFAPGLICLGNQTPLKAMRLSFQCCLQNALPLTVWFLATFGLAIIAGIFTLGLAGIVLYPLSFLALYRSLVETFKKV